MIDVRTAAPFARRFRDQVIVVKIGGACLEHAGIRARLAADLAVVHAMGARVVLVHGAGPQVDALLCSMGEAPRKVDGRRVTSALALRALRLATSGELNGELAAAIEAAGAPAVGLVAGSGGILVATRRPPRETSEGLVDFGLVGDVVSSNPAPLVALLERGFIPVLAPPAGDGAGGFLNVNADLAAAHLAVALKARKLVLVTNEPGILTDPKERGSLVSTLSLADLRALEDEGVLKDGMAVKAKAIAHALENGVARAHVVSGLSDDGLLGELYTTHGTGTLITLAPEEAEHELAPAVASSAAPAPSGARIPSAERVGSGTGR